MKQTTAEFFKSSSQNSNQNSAESPFRSHKSPAYHRLKFRLSSLKLTTLFGKKKDDKVDYQHARNRTFLEKIGDRIVNGFQKVQNTVMDVIDPIMETGESFLGIEDDQNTLQVRILEN